MHILNFFFDYIIGFVMLISILVFVHEYGHYIVAKMCGVYVEAFSIGFGPELIGWTDKSGTRWKIAPIPFGGYVKMKGEMIKTTASDNDFDSNSFQNKNLWQKSAIVFAGPLANLLLPFVILFIISFFAGVPSLQPKIASVDKTSFAYNILQKNDLIKSIDGKKINTFNDIKNNISSKPGEILKFVVEREKKDINLDIKIGTTEINGIKVGLLGVLGDTSTVFTSKYELNNSFNYTITTYYKVITLIFQGFGQLFTGKVALDDIGGPIKIAQLAGDNLSQGISSWLFFMAMLSFNLAIINLFPIPSLDGGHLLTYLIEGVTRKKISLKIQSILGQIGFFILICIMILVLFKDLFSIL